MAQVLPIGKTIHNRRSVQRPAISETGSAQERSCASPMGETDVFSQSRGRNNQHIRLTNPDGESVQCGMRTPMGFAEKEALIVSELVGLALWMGVWKDVSPWFVRVCLRACVLLRSDSEARRSVLLLYSLLLIHIKIPRPQRS